MSVSEHTSTATIVVGGSPEPLQVNDGQLTLDEAWAPFAQLRLEVGVVTDAVWAALDPKQVPVPTVTIELTQTFGAWNVFTRDETSLSNELVVRSRRRNRRTGEVTLTLESDEALAQDYRSLEPNALWINQTDYVDMVNVILTFIDAEVAAAPDGTAIGGESNFALEPGQALWDSLEPILQQGGYRLYVWNREWLLARETSNLDDMIVIGADSFDNPLQGVDYDILDTDQDDAYFDAVMIGYLYEDSATYDIAQTANPSKVLYLEYGIPYPGPGAAARMLSRRLAAGEGREVTAVANYDTRPGMGLAILNGSIWSLGRVAAVTFSLRDRAMKIRARGITEATPTLHAWILAQPGLAWTDVPAGTDWTEYAA